MSKSFKRKDLRENEKQLVFNKQDIQNLGDILGCEGDKNYRVFGYSKVKLKNIKDKKKL